MNQYEFEKYLSNYLNIKETLNKYGIAIIPLLNEEECNKMINDKWDLLEYLTSDFDIPIDRNNKETYKQIVHLFPSHKMLLQHWKVGHSKLAWNVRQNPKIINIFKHIWNTDDLIVSFDGVSIYILDKPIRKNNSWFHVDQSYTRNDFECIQSWVNAYDTNEGDATLVILEGSHNFHKELQQEFNILDTKDWYKLNENEINFYIKNNCNIKYIKCPKGYGVFWDSRTVHYGNPVEKIDNFNYRCVVYICMVPRNFATQKQLDKRKLVFANNRMTTHYPHKVKMFPKFPQTYGKPILNIKDLQNIQDNIDSNGIQLI